MASETANTLTQETMGVVTLSTPSQVGKKNSTECYHERRTHLLSTSETLHFSGAEDVKAEQMPLRI
jgi:hypothetical protein